MNNFKHPVLMFIAGCVVGGIAVAIWFSGSIALPFPSAGTVSSSTGSDTGLQPDMSGRVSVASQPAGDTVTVASITVPPPGVWVTVRETEGAELGNVLGAARARGPVSGLVIPLLRATAPGHTYAIELYRDDGDDLFDISKDSAYVDFDTSEPVVAPFSTTE